MTTKFSNRPQRHSTIRRLGNEKHVLLRTDDRSQSLAEDRMILYAQDSNRLGLNHKESLSAIAVVCLSFRSQTRAVRCSLENFLDPIIDIADIKTSSSSGR
jgi:hypothetical protein